MLASKGALSNRPPTLPEGSGPPLPSERRLASRARHRAPRNEKNNFAKGRSRPSLDGRVKGLLGWAQRRFLLAMAATRAFTNLFTKAAGRGLSMGNWMVPFEIVNSFSSPWNAAMTAAVGKRLQ